MNHESFSSTLEFFSSDFNFCLVYVTWVKILEGIEYENHTSLNMCIMAGHVSIFQLEPSNLVCLESSGGNMI